MRGPKPVPTVLRMLRGNPSRTPIRPEPTPEPLTTECPAELTDQEARIEWTRAIVPAIECGQITAADRPLAVAHCELWTAWRSMLADAARHPHVIAVGQHKRPAANPARGLANRTLLLLVKIDAELGLTPTSRARVQVVPKASRQVVKKWAGLK